MCVCLYINPLKRKTRNAKYITSGCPRDALIRQLIAHKYFLPLDPSTSRKVVSQVWVTVILFYFHSFYYLRSKFLKSA